MSDPFEKPPFIQGREARHAGQSADVNPFVPDGCTGHAFPNEDAAEWHAGYTEAVEEEGE